MKYTEEDLERAWDAGAYLVGSAYEVAQLIADVREAERKRIAKELRTALTRGGCDADVVFGVELICKGLEK